MVSESKLKANKKYKQKVKRITIDFYPTDEELWGHIQNQPKKQTYIKDLIRADMEKKKIILGLDGTVYVQDDDKQGWTGK